MYHARVVNDFDMQYTSVTANQPEYHNQIYLAGRNMLSQLLTQ